MRKRVHKLCIFESRHEWMPFIWKTVSKIHTKGALGGKSVGLFSLWGPLSTRRQEEPMLNVCNFSILLIRTELSDTQDILPSRTQSRLWLSHTDAVLLKASSLALQTRAACFEVLLWRGEVSAVIGTLWGTWLSKEVSFTVIGRERSWVHTRVPAGELAHRMKGRLIQVAPDLTSVSMQKDLVESGLRGLESRHASQILSIWAEQLWLRHLLGRAPPPCWQPLPYSWLSCCFLGHGQRAALLTHPQSPAKMYISWIVNSWMFSKLPPPAMKEGINGANSHLPHAVQDNGSKEGFPNSCRTCSSAHRQITATWAHN